MENTKKQDLLFGFTPVVFKAAITRCDEASYLLDKVMSLSLLIQASKTKITKTKRFLNEAIVCKKHCKLLRAYNLPNMYDDHAGYYDNIRKAIKEYTKELHMHQKDLKKVYALHNKTVEEFKKAVGKFACTCAIRHNAASLQDVGDIQGLPQPIKKEEKTLTSVNLSRIGVLTLIKKLSDEIKAKPNCNKFTITIGKEAN